jgi:organic radical activating enzyme
MNKEKALKSKTFCSALWTAIYQSPNGSVSPCCVWRGTLGNVNNSSIDDIFNSEYVNGLKNKMLDGKKINQCKYCYDIENDTKSESTRHFFNKHFIDKIDWESSDSKFLYWDLRISNLCNFKCRMCSHGLSSEWYDDWKALGNDPQEKVVKIDDKSNFWKQLEEHYKYVDTIYFAGGEPFMNEHHYKILEDLVDRKLHDTKITVNTNASITHWKKKKVLDYYKPFNNVIFGFSIDGSYEVGEYIRKGLNYKEWKKNVKEYVDYISDKDTWDITYLFQFAYGVTNIHEKFKKDVSKMDNILEEYGLDERTIEPIIIHLKKIITYIESNPYNKTNLNQFYKKQEKLDKIRNESIYDIIPDYRKLPIDVDGK